MTVLGIFRDTITSILVKHGLSVELWKRTPRRSSNLLEINTRPSSTVLYVKYSSNSPGFWGLTANQIDRLNKSRSKWFVVLLARSMADGYLLSSVEVNKNIADGTFELSKDGDHKVNETTDCRFEQRFRGLEVLIDLISHQNNI